MAQGEISKAEWALMQALWLRGQATATRLQEDLEDSQGWAYSTVKTMLDRLADKGYVKSRRVGNVYEYSPRMRRQTAVTRLLDEVVDRVLDGSVAPFVHRLVERGRPSRDEIEQMRAVLEAYEEKLDDAPAGGEEDGP